MRAVPSKKTKEEGDGGKGKYRGAKAKFHNPVVKLLLAGTRDPASPLFALNRFQKTLLPIIWRQVDEWNKEHVVCFAPTAKKVRVVRDWPKVDTLSPASVNMLPLSRYDVANTLPKDLHRFLPLVDMCLAMVDEAAEVVYLTVQESYVEEGETQRRPGLHIESPGTVLVSELGTRRSSGWGGGQLTTVLKGGIFVASSVADTCAIFANTEVVGAGEGSVVGEGGSCEHLRAYFKEQPVALRANEVVWMTDRTPHEAMPQKSKGWRTFFRLVVGEVGVWYAQHNTANPLCPLPDYVVVTHGNKFESM